VRRLHINTVTKGGLELGVGVGGGPLEVKERDLAGSGVLVSGAGGAASSLAGPRWMKPSGPSLMLTGGTTCQTRSRP